MKERVFMSIVDDFILQRFPHKDTGKLETDKPYECRQCWFKNGFPPFKELAKICNSTENTINNYNSSYNWKAIRQKATDLQAKADLEEQREKQKQTLKTLDTANDKRLEILDKQVDEILDTLEDPTLTDQERSELRRELRTIIKDYHLVQIDKLRTVGLPDKINDKQDHKHSGEIDVGVRMKKFLNPDNIKKAGL